MSDREVWQPVARVVFSDASGVEPKIQHGSPNNGFIVCTRLRLLQLSPVRTVSLDIVESFDLLERRCGACKVGLGYPGDSWWETYERHCDKCHELIEREANARRDADRVEASRQARRRVALLDGMSPEDREMFVSALPQWALRVETKETKDG